MNGDREIAGILLVILLAAQCCLGKLMWMIGKLALFGKY